MDRNRNDVAVKSTGTCFAVLEAVRSGAGAGVSELAREVGLSKSAVYKHVRTLTSLGFLVREGNEYHLSSRFLPFAEQARRRLPFEVIESVVEGLAATTQGTDFLARENGTVVYAFQADPKGDSRSDHATGEVAPLHATAGGKAVLAYRDNEERAGVAERTGLPRYTEKTITDPSALEAELQSVRDRRVAFGREEYAPGVHSVASPVLNNEGRPIGSVSVTGSTKQMSGKRLVEDIVGLVTSAAKNVEKEFRTG